MTESDSENYQLNRAQRRAAPRMARYIEATQESRGKVTYHSIDTILSEEEDDLAMCQSELVTYGNVLKIFQVDQQLMRLYSACGMTEETQRLWVLSSIPRQTMYDRGQVNQIMYGEMHPGKYAANRRLIHTLHNIKRKIKVYFPEDIETIRSLYEDRSIPLQDLEQEFVNITQEGVELLKLQIEWLQRKENTPGTSEVEEENPIQTDIPPEGEILPPQSPFLQGWSLFWTDRRWSIDPGHLVEIPTGTKDEALG